MTGTALTHQHTTERHARRATFTVAGDGTDATGPSGRFAADLVVLTWAADALGGVWEFASVALRGPKYRADGKLGSRDASMYYTEHDLATAPDWVQQLVLTETKALVNP